MKLRNKKTGEVFDLDKLPKWLKETIQLTVTFYSRECEVYEPKEPLIKDKELRNIVRIWANYYNIKRLHYYQLRGVDGHYLIDKSKERSIDVDVETLKAGEVYTLEELCGVDKV